MIDLLHVYTYLLVLLQVRRFYLKDEDPFGQDPEVR